MYNYLQTMQNRQTFMTASHRFACTEKKMATGMATNIISSVKKNRPLLNIYVFYNIHNTFCKKTNFSKLPWLHNKCEYDKFTQKLCSIIVHTIRPMLYFYKIMRNERKHNFLYIILCKRIPNSVKCQCYITNV